MGDAWVTRAGETFVGVGSDLLHGHTVVSRRGGPVDAAGIAALAPPDVHDFRGNPTDPSLAPST